MAVDPRAVASEVGAMLRLDPSDRLALGAALERAHRDGPDALRALAQKSPTASSRFDQAAGVVARMLLNDAAAPVADTDAAARASIEQARAAVGEIDRAPPTHPYWDGNHPKHAEAVRERVELMKRAHPEMTTEGLRVPESAPYRPPSQGAPGPSDPGDDDAARARVAATVERLRAAGQTAQADSLARLLAGEKT